MPRKFKNAYQFDRPLQILALLIGTCLFLFAVVIGLSSLSSVANASDDGRVTIKSVSTVETDALYLSDLFTNIPGYKDTRVGRSPEPGDEISISASVLLRLAKIYNLDWKAQSMAQHVVVRRSASVISSDAILTALQKRIKNEGIDGDFIVSVNGEVPNIVVPERYNKTFDVGDFSFNSANDRFMASLFAPSIDNAQKRFDISGHIDRMVKVPVLKTSIRNGSIISRDDITMVSMRLKSLGNDIIVDVNKVIGKTPDRLLVARKPIRDGEVRAPKMVERGQRITLMHKQGPLTLTAAGKSMENGSVGDIIRVVNIDSNKNLHAEVIGDGLVVIE